MGRGDEHGLELGGRHIDAPLQHSGEISGKGLRIGAKRRTVVGNRLLRKEAGKKGAHAVDGKALFPEGLFQPSGLPVDLLIDLRMDDELSEGFQTGGHRHRIAGQGARLIDRPQRRDAAHHIPAAAVGRKGHAASDDLSEGGEVRTDPIIFLRAAQGKAEAGDHLVKDQQRAVLFCDFPQEGKKAFRRRHHAHVGRHGLHDDAGDLIPICVKQAGNAPAVVVGRQQGIFRIACGHAGAVRDGFGHQAAPRFYQKAVGMAVVAALELDDLIPSGEAPCRADGAHAGLRAGADQPHHFHGGNAFVHQLGKLHLFFRGRAVGQPLFAGPAHRLDDSRMGVSQNTRPPGAYIIQIPVVIRVDQKRARRLFHEKGRFPHGAEGTHRTVYPAGHPSAGPFIKLFGFFIHRYTLPECSE